MNPDKQDNSDGETSRQTEESSSNVFNPNSPSLCEATENQVSLQQELKEAEESASAANLHTALEAFDQALETFSTRTVTTQTSPTNNLDSGESSSSSNSVTKTTTASSSSPISFSSFTVPTGVSSSSTSGGGGGGGSESDDMKRAAAKKLIERYFYQLIEGCGNPKCNNKFCASSGEVDKMSPNQAAARAIQLFSQDAKLCDAQPSKMARTSELDNLSPSDKKSSNSSSRLPRTQSSSKYGGAASSAATTDQDESSSSNTPSSSNSDRISSHITPSSSHTNLPCSTSRRYTPREPTSPPITYLDEEKLVALIEVCMHEKTHARLIRTVGEVFSSCELLGQSFQKQPSATIDEMLEKAPKDLKSLKKEDLRILEGDLDKDEDSCADKEEEEVAAPHNTTVDIPSLRRAMQKLFECNCQIHEALNNGITSLAIVLSVDLRLATRKQQIEKSLHIFIVVFEIMTMAPSEFMEVSLPAICKAAARLPVWAGARLARIWAEHCKGNLRILLQTLQQLISIQVVSGTYNRDSTVQDNEVITCTTKVLKIVYYANILAGQLESAKLREPEDQLDTSSNPEFEQFFSYTSSKTSKPSCLEDKLSTDLGISVLDCRVPLIPFEEFYNEPLSDAIEMDNDYLYYKNITMDISTRLEKKFSFMLYSFILTPATKIVALYYDSRIRMYSERRISIFQTHLGGQSPNPYLKLKVRRDQIIDDALVELEMIAMGNPKDLKKQLVVEFVGEQGIDEGGVSKEFFQLIVEQIFNPDYGMFIHQEDTKTVWFNSTSFENEAQFTLIGIVLGLAIYNNIILAVNFPMVVYRKLMGIKGSFYDLADWNPVLFKSLQSMLDYEENDMEDVFMQTFKISYKDVFGNTLDHELKLNGGEIYVNQENKHEFVELYSDFLLNSSIEKQFKAFRKGFQMVTDESPLQLLFRPEEIELLVCGSKKFDFVELEKSTEYEGGYTEKTQIIIDFWSIVHGLPIESKRKLLEFTTGSDRVPVGGLSRLKLVIARNGPDSDRLPTSHTCFNVLLLPEYENKEKLEDRLLKAINYSKGFGML